MFMQKLVFISLIYQQFVCHGSWATRTRATEVTTSSTPSKSSSSSAFATPSSTTPFTPMLWVAASEATLLTTRIFPDLFNAVQTHNQPLQLQQKRQQRQRRLYINDNEINKMAQKTFFSADIISSTDTEVPVAPRSQQDQSKIISVRANCTRDLLEIRIEFNRNFRGLLYAKDFSLECRARGNAQTNITLRLPTSGCGVRAEPRAAGTMELSVRLMVQMEEKLRQSSDIMQTIRCQLPLNAMGMMLIPSGGEGDIGNGLNNNRLRKSHRNSRMHSMTATNQEDNPKILRPSEEDTTMNYNEGGDDLILSAAPLPALATTSSSTSTLPPSSSSTFSSSSLPSAASSTFTTTAQATSTPRVRIWLELGGPDGSGAVEVGQATTLTVRAIVPGTMGVRVVDCAALDGLGESSQQLLDQRGCPVDEQVMPALRIRFQPAEEGWSKQHDNDPLEKTFTATFPAFKFPDRERLHVSCGVQLCKGRCPSIDCHTAENLILTSDEHLARIEVFNSLAVTAPQIEVDRPRYDRRYNTSAEHSSNIRTLHSEGTLCLSVSKLALSFCVLGLIFLIAVAVAIFSLIRSRRQAMSGCSSTSTNSRCVNRPQICTSMFSSSSESGQSARFGSKLFIPYYPNTLPYGRVY